MRIKLLVLVALAGAVSGCNEIDGHPGRMHKLQPISYTTDGDMTHIGGESMMPFSYQHTRRIARVGRRGRTRALYRPKPSADGNGVSLKRFASLRARAKVSCLPYELKGIIADISSHFGKKVVISSGHRSKRHNARVGGVKRSFHLTCEAVDLKVPGVSKYKVAAYAKSLSASGGVGTYCRNHIVHIDVGPKRSWHYGCRRKRFARRRK